MRDLTDILEFMHYIHIPLSPLWLCLEINAELTSINLL